VIKTIYDRLGEKEINDLLGTATSITPWFKREGSGQGWYYSVLGGGRAARPHSNVAKVPVSWDNTLEARLRGDFAVPTLFNGNFNASFEQPPSLLNPVSSSTFRNFAPIFGSTTVPGWSFRNNVLGATWESSAASTRNLVDWKDIPTFAQPNGYLSKLGIDPSANTYQPNYAIELDSTNNTITHNRFLVPDWGVLRFDLFTGAINSSTAGTLKVFLDTLDGSNTTEIDDIYLQKAIGTGGQYENDTHKIGYGETGFETFTVDIPDAWRGKVVTLRFQLDNSTQPIYLDNIFFKSQHLLFGNPTAARHTDNPSNSNYLVEKPQYVISYNETTKSPNWASWQVNKTWLGEADRSKFYEDFQIPFPKVTDDDYKAIRTILPQYDFGGNPIVDGNNDLIKTQYVRGHLAAAEDRSRSKKDILSTFLTSNIIPQHTNNNSGLWSKLEAFARDLAIEKGKEIEVFSGSYGTRINPETNSTLKTRATDSNPTDSGLVTVPEYLWKILIILDYPGQTITDFAKSVTSGQNDKVIAVKIPNIDTAGQNSPNYPSWWNPLYRITVSQLETDIFNSTGTKYDFLSGLPYAVESSLKENLYSGPTKWENFSNALSSPLLVDATFSDSGIVNTPIWHNSIDKNSSHEIGIAISNISENRLIEVSSLETGFTQVGSTQVGSTQVGSSEISLKQVGSTQVSSTQVGSSEISLPQDAVPQNCTTEICSNKTLIVNSGIAQINFLQANSFPHLSATTKFNFPEISLPSSITFQQFLSSHNFDLQNKTVPLWTEFLQSPTPFNLKVEITDLPTGQLAEGTITGFDINGRPNSGTLTLDINGNTQGWFIDTTPGDNSEFDKQLTETAYQATNSSATGKYDLLTVILHELGHIKGIIKGNSAFDANVKNNTFIGNGFTASLTPDGSHLDNTLHPHDLLNTSLKPGIRKLPSQLDLAIINQLYSNTTSQNPTKQNLNAALTAGALLAIENGDFTTTTGWNLQGGTTISNGAATLSEASQKLAQLTQDLIIPTGAKRLQFTIKDNHLVLGDSSKTATDAFEVALLGTNFQPLAGTSQGLSNTDSLLNIQANGTTYKSNKVTITPLTGTSEVVSIDLTEITPETKATLYFNLLGFGARTSAVTIDDIKIFSAEQLIANNDNIVTNQSTPVTIDPTSNDSNVVGIQIIDQPTHGTLSQDQNGQIVYQPDATYLGTDRFTYIGFNSEGSISNQGTVSITINNVPPVIENITIPTIINEGQQIQLSATAKDNNSSENLTYSWNLGDGTIVQGQQISHTYVDNGIYQAILTVTDKDGGVTDKAIELIVDNVAPNIVSITRPTQINEGQLTQFQATAADSGINDTLTYTWNFGDGSTPVIGQNVSHTFVDNGSYNVALTVTDNDGAATTKTEIVKVDNVLPSIVSINKPTQINEGQNVEFSAIATDVGSIDTLTYNWDFGDGSAPSIGQNINHTFIDNGIYNVVLTVTDKDGGVTTEAIKIKVDNLAPTIVSITKPARINEGQAVEFNATATDIGANDTLTYAWNFGDTTNPVIGQNVTHTFVDNGNYNIVLTVTDKDGAVTTKTETVKVDNVAPVVVSIAKPTQINEGQAIELSTIATDAGADDTLTYNWDLGDGTAPAIGQKVSHTYIDNGVYNVVLNVTDKDGGTTKEIIKIKVDNLAPTIINISQPPKISEGQAAEFSATATDPGLNDTLTHNWDFGDGTAPVIGQTINHTFIDNGIYNTVLTVTDKDGAITTKTTAVKVENLAPTIVSITKPARINEGQAVEFKATATDPGLNDTLTYTWNFGDNTEAVIGQNINHTFVNNGNYNVVLIITDKDGGSITQTTTVEVNNVLPSIINISKPNKIEQGQPIEFTATATDAGVNDNLTYTWDFGDGSPPVIGQKVSHTFTDQTILNPTLTVTDKDGGTTKEALSIQIEPKIAPVATKPGIFTVGENGQINIDYLFDGGDYQAQMSIFSLDGMENLEAGSIEFIKEAARRATSNSELGYVVIEDSKQTGKDNNRAGYQGSQTYKFRAGAKVAVMLMSNGDAQTLQKNVPGKTSSQYPMFSCDSIRQIVDLTGKGEVFGWEDIALPISDKDYNDVIFKISGATTPAIIVPPNTSPGIFTVNPSGKVNIDYLFDGGKYQGQLALISLERIAAEKGSSAFIKEAVSRMFSNSELGYIVIDDRRETGQYNDLSRYKGSRDYKFQPGSQVAFMLLPDGQITDADISKQPMFSWEKQMSDLTGGSTLFGWEDLPLGASDKDYNDIIFKVTGLSGRAAAFDG
jgi:large repetitive protein